MESSTLETTKLDDALHTNLLDLRGIADDKSLVLAEALTQPNPVSNQRRRRLVQMIAQCSTEDFESLSQSEKLDNRVWKGNGDCTPKRDILTLVDEIEQNVDFCFPALRQRLLLIELYLSYEEKVGLQQEERERTRKRRKRESAAGHKLGPKSDPPKSIKNLVLDSIITSTDVLSPQRQRTLRSRVTSYIDFGATLHFLATKLGPGVLPALPSAAVQPCDLKVTSKSLTSLNCRLDPSEYVIYYNY
jgi:hypothetical protein